MPTRRSTFLKLAFMAVLSLTWIYRAENHYIHTQQRLDLNSTNYTLEIQEDDTHRIFHTSETHLTDRTPLRIRVYESMSDACAEQWVVQHQWGSACNETDLSEGLKIDGVWAWVNGSDSLHIESRRRYRTSNKMKMDATYRYTEHNELLFSMRSALISLGTDVMQRLHILASAYPLLNGSDNLMAGQVPIWLDKQKALNGTGPVVLHHDGEYFRPVAKPKIDLSPSKIEQWRTAVIPSFNSLAVESQMHNIGNTASDQIVYFNDDFFTLRKLSVSDYTTPLYGPVIKTFTRVTSRYTPAEYTIYRRLKPTGEESGIKRAAWTLGKRFSMRPYYYITHHPRTLWLPLLLEAAQTFPETFSSTPLSRFRAQVGVPASIQTVFLASWYVVERHREALLWTWAVAKWGGKSGIISPGTKDHMWIELAGMSTPSSYQLSVNVPVRVPVDDVDLFERTGIDVPTSTEYSFSSKDGYALSYVDSMWYWNRPRHGYPDLTRGLFANRTGTTERRNTDRYIKDPSFDPARACSIVRSKCFDSSEKNETASDFFKRIAFEQPKCGDCIITALISASGQSGIDKFLPIVHTKAMYEADAEPLTSLSHLPLTSEWATTNFSISRILPKSLIESDEQLRKWCVRLIQRYSYVMGSVASEFYKVERASSLESKLKEVELIVEEDTTNFSMGYIYPLNTSSGEKNRNTGEDTGPLAFLCLNDDIEEVGKLRKRVDGLLMGFFRRMWPGKMSFERHY